MTAKRIAWVGIAAAMLAAAMPTAAAERGDGICEPSDLDGFQFTFEHEDGAVETAEDLAPAQEGDIISASGTADLDCEGADISLVTYTRDGEDVEVFRADEREFFRVRPHADFVLAEFFTAVPDCSFRVELILGTAGDGIVLDAVDGGETPCAELPPPDCVEVLVAFADEGRNSIHWAEDTRARTVNIYRAEGDAPLELFATVPFGDLSFDDRDVVPGETYRYMLKGVNDAGETEGDCPIVQLTAVPFLGTPLMVALAVVGSVAAYAGLRRTKK